MSRRRRSLNSTKISFFAFQDIITSVSGILILVTLILATELDRPSSQSSPDADPKLERDLSETLRQQLEVDARNRNLQGLLAAAETAPATEKIEADIKQLQSQLAEEKRKHAALADQLAASQSAIEARDRILGLTSIKEQIQQAKLDTESIKRQETKVRAEAPRLEQIIASVQSTILKLHGRDGKLWLIPDQSSTAKEPVLVMVSKSGIRIERFDHPDEVKTFDDSNARTAFRDYLSKAKSTDQYFVFLVRPSGIPQFERLVKLARAENFDVGFDALEEDKEVYFSTPPVIDETARPAKNDPNQGQNGNGGHGNTREGGGNDARSASGDGTTAANNGGGGKNSTPAGSTSTGTLPGNGRQGSGTQSGSNQSQTGGGAAGKNNAGVSTNSGGTSPGAGQGDGAGTEGANGKGKGSTKEADASKNGGSGSGKETSVTIDGKKSPPKTAEKPAPPPPPPPKAKSWWQRFLEFVGFA